MTATELVSNVAGRFVPRLVREWISDDPSPHLRHRALPGTLVFADVSGFTKMSERLSRLGRVGPEEITSVIESTFTGLLDEAYAHQATLLQFGGDALLLFFRDDGHEARAAGAALAMRHRLRSGGQIDTPAGKVRLSMTVGVQSGTFDFFLVGRSHRQLVVGGPAASRLVELESAAEKGRILLGDTTAAALHRSNVGPPSGPGRLLRGRIDVERVAGVQYLQIDADLSTFVPPVLLRAVEAGEVQSEHRTATVAFVQFRGLDTVLADHGPDEAADRLESLISGVQAAIDPREICFQSADLGVDGGKLYLSAGAPFGSGHDEENMLLALREIVGLDVGLELRAGANSGPVFTGELFASHRRTYTTMGDTVNLAARVMGKSSPGEVWATSAVVDRSRTLFDLRAIPPFMVKGKKHPVVAYAVGPAQGSRPEIAAADLPLVGRDAEMATLLDLARSAARGRGRLVQIEAEPGAGKTRLLRELQDRVEGFTVHDLRCRLYQASTPYHPVGELLRASLAPGGRLADQELAEALGTAVAAVAPEHLPWLSLIGTAAGLSLEPSPEVAALDDEYRKPQLERSVVALLRGLLATPTLMIVEDAQWMDDASRDLFDVLARDLRRTPWLFVLAHRSLPEGARMLAAEPDARLRLEPLGADALRELVGVVTEGAPLPGHVVTTLVERADGNPLFLIELLNAVQSGADVDALPTSVEGLITARIDRLPALDRVALRQLAVLGTAFQRRFATTVLPDAARRRPTETLQRLDEFLNVEASGLVTFRHALVRDVAYEGLPYRIRRDLHGRIAESVLERVGPDADAEAALLSLHFFQAQRHTEAWHYSVTAGDQARNVWANVDAAVFYRRALTAARHLEDLTDADRAKVLEALGDVLDLAGEYESSRRAFTAAKRMATDDVRRSAELALKTAYVDERLGRFVTAVRSLRRATRLLDVDGDVPEHVGMRSRVATWLAVVRLDQGRVLAANDAALEAVSLAETAGDRATLAQALVTLAHIGSALGDPEAGGRARLALELATEIGDLRNQAVAANVLGGHAFFDGRWEEAADLYRRSRAVREQMGDPGGAAAATANLAELLVEQGRHAEADELLDEVLAVWRAAGDLPGVAFALRLRGLARIRSGQLEAGRALLEESRASWLEMGASHDVVETEVALAEALLLDGRLDEAVGAVDELLAADPAAAGLDHVVPTLHRVRALALAESDPAAAATDVEASLASAREQGAEHLVALALLADEVVRSRSGQPLDEARRAERDELVGRLGVALAISGT